MLPIALAFGMAIAVLVWATAHVSGGHLNPAVTLSMVLMGKMPWRRALRYMLAQVLGGVLGAYFVHLCYADLTTRVAANALRDRVGGGAGFLLEFLGTFLLVFVVHTTAVDPRSAAKNMAPMAIGLSVFLAHVLLIPMTGCGINPARTFGPSIVGYALSGRATTIACGYMANKDEGLGEACAAGMTCVQNPNWGVHGAVESGKFVCRTPYVFPGARQAWIYYVGPMLGGLFAAVVCGVGLDTDKDNYTEDGAAKPAKDNARLRIPRQETEMALTRPAGGDEAGAQTGAPLAAV